MASDGGSKKLRVVLIPFFATSHIGPFTDFAVRLAAARPDAVEATLAVTPANVPIVRSLLERHGPAGAGSVAIATYPFPAVDGLPAGVENLSKAAPGDAWRINAVADDEALMRPAQESLVRELRPDAIVTDAHFFWNAGLADELGVPCVQFYAIGAFSTIAMAHLVGAVKEGAKEVTIPRLPGHDLTIPTTELPEFLRSSSEVVIDCSKPKNANSGPSAYFGVVVNTFLDLEAEYCEMYTRDKHAKRAYFVGPVSPPPPPPLPASGESPCLDWLSSKPSRSVVYLCFGSLTHVSDTQLDELALGLEAAGKPFLWVVRTDTWAPPEGWKERVGDRGMVIRGWAPQKAILAHPSVGAFVTQCGWNSVLEAVGAGVPVLTWPMVFEQFVTERLVTKVLEIGERLWPEGAGVRGTKDEEKEVVPAKAVAEAVTKFMEPGGGAGEAARCAIKELAVKANAAVAEGGSSHRDLLRLIDDLMQAK